MTTTVEALILSVSIHTVHKDTLEFVLDAAGHRKNINYYAALENVLRKHKINVNKVDAYYNVIVDVEFSSIEEYADTVETVNKAVKDWITQFKINHLKKWK